MIMQHNFTQEPDMFRIVPGASLENGTKTMVNNEDYYNGDWYFDKDEDILSYLSKSLHYPLRSAIGLLANRFHYTMRATCSCCVDDIQVKLISISVFDINDSVHWFHVTLDKRARSKIQDPLSCLRFR